MVWLMGDDLKNKNLPAVDVYLHGDWMKFVVWD